MKKPHNHAAFIKAWADGEEIQFRCPISGNWLQAASPNWDIYSIYRIKPKEPVVKEVFTTIHKHPYRWAFVPSAGMGNLRLRYDPDTGVLLSAEVIKNE